jgi:hypothetical protein
MLILFLYLFLHTIYTKVQSFDFYSRYEILEHVYLIGNYKENNNCKTHQVTSIKYRDIIAFPIF